jgi:glycosyltransferase involved in cell wall biosynthesis
MIIESAGGGTGRHVLDLAEGLIARGCDVHVIYSTGRADSMFLDRLARLPKLKSISIDARTTVHPSDWGITKRIRAYAREHGPFDIVHGHSSKGGALARLAALLTGAAAFYTLHGLIMMDPGLARWKRTFYLAIEWMLALRTERIIAVSPEEQRTAVRLGLGSERVVVVPNGVEPVALTPRPEARRAMNVEDDALVIGFVGRLVAQKAPEVLIRAFAGVARHVAPHARLAIVGAGPLDKEMQGFAEHLGVREKIRWLGERDARTVLAGFDVFALASRKEGLPYVVLEAMMAGLPIVATSSAGVEILIEPGVNGTVVRPGDAAAFAAALAELATDPPRLARYGVASRQRANAFTIDAMIDSTLRAYRAAAEPDTEDGELRASAMA